MPEVSDRHICKFVFSLFQDGGKLNGAKNIDVLTSPSVNSVAQSAMLLDTTPPSSTRGEKILTPHTVNSSKDDTIASKSHVLSETKPQISLEIGSKHSVESTVVPKLKDLHILGSTEEEVSPRSFSVSEPEQLCQGSKEISKSKTASSEVTPCNSPSLEKSLTHSKNLQVQWKL